MVSGEKKGIMTQTKYGTGSMVDYLQQSREWLDKVNQVSGNGSTPETFISRAVACALVDIADNLRTIARNQQVTTGTGFSAQQ